jgi:hypothetical protein
MRRTSAVKDALDAMSSPGFFSALRAADNFSALIELSVLDSRVKRWLRRRESLSASFFTAAISATVTV